MANAIKVKNQAQRIIVDPSSSSVSVINSGPIGPRGFQGDPGVDGDTRLPIPVDPTDDGKVPSAAGGAYVLTTIPTQIGLDAEIAARIAADEAEEVARIMGDATYVHHQNSPDDIWTINHGLSVGYPSVTIVDSAGSIVIGDVNYISTAIVQVTFSLPFAGKAFLN